MLSWLAEIRPSSDVLAAFAHLQSEAIRHVRLLREWMRTGQDAEPFAEIEQRIGWMKRWLDERAQLLGEDRIARIQWRRIPQQWGSISTRTEAVAAWIQLEENVSAEIARIENERSFVVSVCSAIVAFAALGVALLSLFVQLLR